MQTLLSRRITSSLMYIVPFNIYITWQTAYSKSMVMALPQTFTAMKVLVLGHHKACFMTYCTAVGWAMSAVWLAFGVSDIAFWLISLFYSPVCLPLQSRGFQDAWNIPYSNVSVNMHKCNILFRMPQFLLYFIEVWSLWALSVCFCYVCIICMAADVMTTYRWIWCGI